MQWYVSQNGKTTGPFDEERLAMLAHWGKISPDAFICDERSLIVSVTCKVCVDVILRIDGLLAK